MFRSKCKQYIKVYGKKNLSILFSAEHGIGYVGNVDRLSGTSFDFQQADITIHPNYTENCYICDISLIKIPKLIFSGKRREN